MYQNEAPLSDGVNDLSCIVPASQFSITSWRNKVKRFDFSSKVFHTMPLDSPFDIPFTTKFSKMLRSFSLIKFWQTRNAIVYSEYFLVFENAAILTLRLNI